MPSRRSGRARREAGAHGHSAWLPVVSVDCAAPKLAQAAPDTAATPARAELPCPTDLEQCCWQRYPSINDVDLQQVEAIRRATDGTDAEFVALEKVHGSNFAFETDGAAVAYFSRSRRLERHERFVGRTAPADAMAPYHGAVLAVHGLCARAFAPTPVSSVIIYGEYFGGWYPHDAVEQTGPGVGCPVQKGIVAYAPAHHFYAFDLCVDGRFLDFDAAAELLKRAGFPLVATPVARGSFEFCMGFDVESFRTTVPGQLGLPFCEAYSVAEGVVIRPVRRCEEWTVKKKSVRYLEACPDELRKWIRKCSESPEEAVAGLYLCLCREARLEAVLSKEPQLRAEAERALPRVQRLFRADLEEAMQGKLAAVRMAMPKDCRLGALRAESDRRVAAWLLGA